jgi:hypothetical protein
VFKVVEANGLANRTCTTSGNAGCPSTGSW